MTMQALALRPGVANSTDVIDMPEPADTDGDLLLETLAVGICGTDLEIVRGEYGEAPPGADRLVLGHESLARVSAAPDGSGFSPGDLAVAIVRRPDPVPCPTCAVGEWDMCRNGRYTEHGIKALHGFARERFRVTPDAAIRLDPSLADVGVLLEPTTIVAKAWEQIERIGARTVFAPRTVLVTGAGPVGLLAALLAAQRGLDVHVLDRVTDGPKPGLVRDLGATYHSDADEAMAIRPDVALECTGVPSLVFDLMANSGRNGIVCLTGVSTVGRNLTVDMGGLNRDIVLENDVVFGSVNANRRHYEAGAAALARADHDWLAQLITRKVPLSSHRDALQRRDDDIKVVLEMPAASTG